MVESKITTIPHLRQVIYTTFALFPVTNLSVGDLAYATDTLSLYRWNGVAWQVIAFPSSEGEGHITILPWNYNAIGQGNWVQFVQALASLNGYFSNANSHADGDNVSFECFLAAGTYTLRLFVVTNADQGIVDIDIEGVEIASFDLYSVGAVNNVAFTDAGNVIATSGLKTITLRIDGKNGASTDHVIYLIALTLWRTA